MSKFLKDEQRPEGFLYCTAVFPDYRDKFLDEAWTSEASLAVDRLIWRWVQEFEGVEW